MFEPRKLRELLKSNVVEVTFTKKDGSERVMNCTMINEFLPEEPMQKDRMPVDPDRDNITVWDIDVEGWRSFNASSVKNIEHD